MGLVQRVPVYIAILPHIKWKGSCTTCTSVYCILQYCNYFKTRFQSTSSLPIPNIPKLDGPHCNFNDFYISKIKMKKLVSSSMLDVFKWYRWIIGPLWVFWNVNKWRVLEEKMFKYTFFWNFLVELILMYSRLKIYNSIKIFKRKKISKNMWLHFYSESAG